MEPSLPLQAAIRSALIASGALTAMVPATSILDALRPDVMPCIIFAQNQTLPGLTISRTDFEIYTDLHIWQAEAGTIFVRQVAGAVRDALTDTIFDASGIQIADIYITSARFLRDPDGVHSHGILTLRSKVSEIG